MIGERIPRLEDARLVAGQGRYTDDINLEGQVYAAFLRSPHAHAELGAINADAARAAPGVLAVLTGHDYLAAGYRGMEHVPNPADAVNPAQPAFGAAQAGTVFSQPHVPLATDKVRHVGEPIVMVIATSALAARDATELIEVDYTVLDAVVDAQQGMQEGAPELWSGAPRNLCFQAAVGDRSAAQTAFAGAAHVVRREFRNSRIVNCQMEPRAALGVYDAATQSYTLISGSQGVFRQKLGLMGALQAPADKVRVVCPDVGGGFGPRTMINVEHLAVVWGARHVDRPVKWTGDRSEAFLSDYQGRDQLIRAAIAFDADGRILAIDHEWIGNVGAHTVSYVPMANGTRIMTTVYHVPVAAVRIHAVLTNTVPTGPYRGAGRPEAHHVMERMLDIAAREIKIDRLEIRRRNMVAHDKLPYVSAMGLTYDSGDFPHNMARALALADWDNFEARRKQSQAAGRLRGIGLANYVEAPVGAPRERIEMRVLPDGVIDIISGTQSQGQGHATTFAQVVVSLLGVPIAAVRLRTGDTDFVSLGGGSHSDRSMRLGGSLLVQAAAEIIKTATPCAARLLGVAPEAIQFGEGSFNDQASGRKVSLFDVARESPNGLHAMAELSQRMPAHPTGCAICELEVDPDTGEVALLHYVSVDDVGRAINPLILEGQVHGGLAQGIGQAFGEDYKIDQESGQVLSGSYMDYAVPHAGAVPRLTLEFTEDPTSGNPLGVKGGGESGITPATATLFNALADALRDHDHGELPMPATPPVIWHYIHSTQR